MKRRNFIRNTAALSALGSIMPSWALTNTKAKGLTQIGVQLFSIPKVLEQDFATGIQMLSKMGYTEVEMYGPFPFSVDAIKERWKTITPNLGFSGSGYFGHSPQEVKSILQDNGMKATSIHADLETLQSRMGEVGEAADILGFEYVGIPSIPDKKRQTLDDYKQIAEDFNTIGELAKRVGLKFSYHNHGYGLQPMEGKVPLQLIIEETDPNLVFLEMDIYWMTAGGANPILYLLKYPGRYNLMHVKDMKEKVRFMGDGGTSDQWIELFPYMTSVGKGVLDLESIIPVAQKAGVKHFYVEQDMVAHPEIALRDSIAYLKGI